MTTHNVGLVFLGVQDRGGQVREVPQCAAQAGDLLDRPGWEGGHDVLGDVLAVGAVVGGAGRPGAS